MRNLGKYTPREVEALVEGYEELNASRHKSWIQVRLMDIDQCLRRVNPDHATALVYYGMAGYPLRQVASAVGVSKDTILRRYRRGLQELVDYLNSGSW